jgi:hypothetical protein
LAGGKGGAIDLQSLRLSVGGDAEQLGQWAADSRLPPLRKEILGLVR